MRYGHLAIVALVLLAGCGDGASSPEEAVRETLSGYAKAFASKDYQAICDRYLSPKLIDGVEQRGLPCEAAVRPAIKEAEKPEIAVKSVKVSGDTATAFVHSTAANQPPSDDTISLARVHGTWYIAGTVKTGPEPVAP
jgi:ketosteroid isomerase-like protein